MVFDHIEQLKRDFTDKYVVVNGERPELRRFRGLTGTVRTVNMSGRALVEFDGYSNIGWYDIDVDFLTVVDQPLPKEEKKPAAKAEKPAAKPEKKAAPAAKPAAIGAAMSVADVLAAARGGGAKAKAATPAAADSSDEERRKSVSAQMEAARKPKTGEKAEAAPAAGKPAAADAKKMSVAEMLAYARAEKTAAAAQAPAAKPEPEPEPVEEVAEEASEPVAAEEAPTGAVASKRDEITTVAEQLAYCRKVDGG